MTEIQKFYLTREGLEKLKKEYQDLQEKRRVKMKDEKPSSVPSQSIDSEYLTFQEELDLLNWRIQELDNILRNYELIQPPPPEEQHIVKLGATVLVEVDGKIDEFTITGSLEANPAIGKISNESPVGKALLGKKIGEEVLISSPAKVVYKIKKIKYEI